MLGTCIENHAARAESRALLLRLILPCAITRTTMSVPGESSTFHTIVIFHFWKNFQKMLSHTFSNPNAAIFKSNGSLEQRGGSS
jgi:hypothetical protein